MAFFGLLRAINAFTLNHTAKCYTHHMQQTTMSHKQACAAPDWRGSIALQQHRIGRAALQPLHAEMAVRSEGWVADAHIQLVNRRGRGFKWRRGDVDISRGGALGNPFPMEKATRATPSATRGTCSSSTD